MEMGKLFWGPQSLKGFEIFRLYLHVVSCPHPFRKNREGCRHETNLHAVLFSFFLSLLFRHQTFISVTAWTQSVNALVERSVTLSVKDGHFDARV